MTFVCLDIRKFCVERKKERKKIIIFSRPVFFLFLFFTRILDNSKDDITWFFVSSSSFSFTFFFVAYSSIGVNVKKLDNGHNTLTHTHTLVYPVWFDSFVNFFSLSLSLLLMDFIILLEVNGERVRNMFHSLDRKDSSSKMFLKHFFLYILSIWFK